MDFEIIFQSKNATLKYLEELKSPVLEFDGQVGHEEYKYAMEKAYQMVLQRNINSWITDLKKMKVILPENQRWTNRYFLPKIFKTTKINKVAILIDNDIYYHPEMNRLKEEVIKADFPIRYVNNYQDIKKWFMEKEKAF